MKRTLECVMQGQTCVMKVDDRTRVMMRVTPVKRKEGIFDGQAFQFVQVSGHNHTEGLGVLYVDLDPKMEVEIPPMSVTVEVPQ